MAKRWTMGFRRSTPITLLRPLASPLASEIGGVAKLRRRIEHPLARRVEIRSCPFSALDAVVSDTPASRATSVNEVDDPPARLKHRSGPESGRLVALKSCRPEEEALPQICALRVTTR